MLFALLSVFSERTKVNGVYLLRILLIVKVINICSEVVNGISIVLSIIIHVLISNFKLYITTGGDW